jgi:hypothetical protein
MKRVIYLLALLSVLGAFDTVYYHEWRARLPALGSAAKSELRLHAFRDFVYTILFGTLPWFAWQGWCAAALSFLFLIEIVLTLWDFVVEDTVRKGLGGVYPIERVMHGVMGIVYGAMLAAITPMVARWWARPSGIFSLSSTVSEPVQLAMGVMALGVLISGIRDLCASADLSRSAWPWK